MTASQQSKDQVRQVRDDSQEEVPDIVHVHTVTEGLPDSYKVIHKVSVCVCVCVCVHVHS